MAIAPLQLPSTAALSSYDFSGLERLGEQIRQGRINEMRQQALQRYAAGNPQALLQSGDLQLANLYAMDKQRTEAAARDVRDFAFRQAEAQRAQANADRTYRLAEQTEREDVTPENFVADPNKPGGYIPAPGGPADPEYLAKVAAAKPPRQMSVTDIGKLSEEGDKLSSLTGFAETFKPEYGGHIMVGPGANIAGRYLPESVTPEAWSKGAQWWQGYDRFRNVVRNELFGASLTKSEQAAFEQADVNPRMDPKTIAANLKMQRDVVQRGIARKADALVAQGYDPNVIARAYGLTPPTTSPTGKSQERVGAPQGGAVDYRTYFGGQ